MTKSRPVVCQRVSGGLGNQLFQAAAAIALTRRLGGTLKFDISKYDRKRDRKFELGGFPTGAEIWVPDRRQLPRGSQLANFVTRAVRPRWGWGGAVYRQPDFGYDPNFETLSGDVYLDGLFQSEEYFKREQDHIRRVFDCAPQAGVRARTLAEAWIGQDRTSVHIRRGDYASNPDVIASKGLLDDAYYDRAIAIVRQMYPETRLTFFSDDAGFAKAYAARFDNADVVSGDSALDDLYLISRCRHHINANSSFSWWGAWLGPGGVTIAPRRYLPRQRLKTTPIGDLFPEGWLLL